MKKSLKYFGVKKFFKIIMKFLVSLCLTIILVSLLKSVYSYGYGYGYYYDPLFYQGVCKFWIFKKLFKIKSINFFFNKLILFRFIIIIIGGCEADRNLNEFKDDFYI